MLIEAVKKPIRLKWPTGEVRLDPGVPVDLPDEQARKLLERAPGKVRKVTPDWLRVWRELADCITGITRDDPRFQPVMAALDVCDRAFERGDWTGFQRTADRVKHVVGGERAR